jgi:phosphate transport system substrate-binding protein
MRPVFALLPTLFFAASVAAETVTFAGSTTLFPFMEQLTPVLAEAGMEAKIQAGGSSAGFKAVQTGIADFGMMSRDLKKDEAPLVKELVVSRDWLVMVANKDIPFDNLTSEEIVDLYTGKTKEVQGYKLNAIAKEAGRGTKAVFDEYFHLGTKEGHPLDKGLIIIGPNGQAITTVAGDPHGLSYLSYSAVEAAIKQGEPIKMLKLDGVDGSPENVESGKYALVRTLILVYKPENEDLAKRLSEALATDAARKVFIDGGVQPTL